jgi:hypothetical protein
MKGISLFYCFESDFLAGFFLTAFLLFGSEESGGKERKIIWNLFCFCLYCFESDFLSDFG